MGAEKTVIAIIAVLAVLLLFGNQLYALATNLATAIQTALQTGNWNEITQVVNEWIESIKQALGI